MKYIFTCTRYEALSCLVMRKIQAPNFLQRNFISEFFPLNLSVTDAQKEKDIQDLNALYKSFNSTTSEFHLMDIFDISKEEAQKVLYKNSSMELINPAFLQYNWDLIKSNLPPQMLQEREPFIKLCKCSPQALSHRLNTMKEMKMPITINNISKFRLINTKTVKQLRESNLIDPHSDIPRRIFNEIEAPKRVLKMLPTPKHYETMTLQDLWFQMIQIFMKWQLDIDERRFATMHKYYYFNYRSFHTLINSINILMQDMKFEKEKICSHAYLMIAISSYYKEFLNHDGKINGIDVMTLVNSLPSIMRRPLKHMQHVADILDFINVKPKYVLRAPCIYTYSMRTLVKRLRFFIAKTSLSDVRLTPNNTLLLLYFDRCVRKLSEYEAEFGPVFSLPWPSYLSSKNINCDVVKMKRAFIAQFLHIFLQIDIAESYKALNQMGIIHYPEFCSVKQNFVFLINQGFSIDVIREGFHILIYPHDLVVDVYTNKLLDPNYGQQFQEDNESDKLLQLCLYRVNKSYIDMGGCYI